MPSPAARPDPVTRFSPLWWLGRIPQHALSSLVGAITEWNLPRSLLAFAIRRFSARYGVDLNESALAPDEVDNFAQFFARPLKPGLRPLDPDPSALLSPSDGAMGASGLAEGETILQIKGRPYSISDLLGRHPEAERFFGGAYFTVYLAPGDYHRVHAPLGGVITEAQVLPGTLWPVNALAVEKVGNLFCANERLVTWIDTAQWGRVAVVMVGATCVGRMVASYDPELITNSDGCEKHRRYSTPRVVARGDELGQFRMGSTVVLLTEPSRFRPEDIAFGTPLRLGRALARASS